MPAANRSRGDDGSPFADGTNPRWWFTAPGDMLIRTTGRLRLEAMVKFDIGLLNSVHVAALGRQAWEEAITPAQRVTALQLADELGYWKVLVPEHLVVPNEHLERSGDHYPHAAVGAAFAAGVTTRLRVGSNVTILPLQHPIAQAKMWATIDWLSGGRAELMVGVGWCAGEYEMLGVPFAQRGALCDEYVAAIVELWTSDRPTFHGRFVDFTEVGFAPKPIQQPGVPIWFGGDADAVLRRVARWGSGWSPFQTPPDQIPAKLDWIRSQPDYHGGPIDIVYSMMMLALTPDHQPKNDPDAQGLYAAGPLIDQIGRLQQLGVTEVRLTTPVLTDFEAYLDWLRWAAAEVFPHVDG
jgi:probable F420-dependent oxidoreductase